MPAHLLNFFIFSGALILSWVVGAVVPPTWTVSQAVLDVHTDSDLVRRQSGRPDVGAPIPTKSLCSVTKSASISSG